MDVRCFTEPQQGATYDQLLASARAAESAGFSAWFRSDHFSSMGVTDPRPGPTDAWVTLGALARETSTIRLGTLVTSATFRHGGLLAVVVAQVDQMSGGRIELGLGAGWYEEEHTAHGVPFGSLAERFDVLEDQLAIITGMWATPPGERFDHRGAVLEVRDSPALPEPVQRPHPPIIVGGGGPRRTPRLAATYADEFNLPFAPVERFAEQVTRVRQACEDRGRDPGEIVMSVALVACCASDEAGLARRAAAIGREVDELKANGAAGSPAEVVAAIERYAGVGAQRVYLQVLDLDDLDHLALIGAEVVPALAEV